MYKPNTDPFDRQVGRRQESLLVEAPAGAADGIQFHVLGSDWVQSSLPAFGRRLRIPVDYLFPTVRDVPHKSKLEESVALH